MNEGIEETLASASDEGLIKTFASLTHQMDAHSISGHSDAAESLKAQRGLVQEEILHRMNPCQHDYEGEEIDGVWHAECQNCGKKSNQFLGVKG